MATGQCVTEVQARKTQPPTPRQAAGGIPKEEPLVLALGNKEISTLSDKHTKPRKSKVEARACRAANIGPLAG